MSNHRLKNTLVKIIKWALIALILFFIGRQIVIRWQEVRDYNWQINWLLFVLSLLVLQFGLFFKSYLWSQVLSCFGVNLPALRAFRVAYLSNLGRYVPGKIVQFVGVMYLARKEGVREDVAVSSFALTHLFDTPAGLIMVSLYYLILGASLEKIILYWPVMIVLAVVTMLSILIILVPAFLERLLNFLLKMIKQPALKFKLEKKTGFKLLFLYFTVWNIFGLSLYLFLRSVTDIPVSFYLEACVVYTAAYLVGYWALFAPGGIGVREGAMGVFLAEIGGIATAVALAVSLASRFWFLIGELTVSVLALMVGKNKNGQEEKK